jgi:hypothetical protein
LTLSEKIQKLAPRANQIIELDCGLLDKLISSTVISPQEEAEVRSKPSDGEKCLLRLLSTKNDEQCQLFLDCLKSTGQQHLVNYIIGNVGQ